MSKSILITGANGDIGRLAVEQAVQQGKTVIATVRNEAHFNRFPRADNLHLLLMHMDDEDSIRTAFEAADTRLGGLPLDAIIHCAAIESPSTVEFLSPATLEQILKVNTIGSLIVMQQAFPRLRKSQGNLILAGSLWGRTAGPLVCGYSASKWALESLTMAARRETKAMGFNICTANIGAVKSRMLDAHVDQVKALLDNCCDTEKSLYAHAYGKHIDQTVQFNRVAISARKVAQRLLAIADKDRPAASYKIGLDAKLLLTLSWLLPTRWMDAALGIPKPTRATQ